MWVWCGRTAWYKFFRGAKFFLLYLLFALLPQNLILRKKFSLLQVSYTMPTATLAMSILEKYSWLTNLEATLIMWHFFSASCFNCYCNVMAMVWFAPFWWQQDVWFIIAGTPPCLGYSQHLWWQRLYSSSQSCSPWTTEDSWAVAWDWGTNECPDQGRSAGTIALCLPVQPQRCVFISFRFFFPLSVCLSLSLSLSPLSLSLFLSFSLSFSLSLSLSLYLSLSLSAIYM